jgi:hypothetical protein
MFIDNLEDIEVGDILKKYLQFFNQEDRSSGCVAQPKVSMIENVLSR